MKRGLAPVVLLALSLGALVTASSPALGAPGSVVTIPTAYCSASTAVWSNEGLPDVHVPLTTVRVRSTLVRDLRWDATAYARTAAIYSLHEPLASDAAGTTAAPLEATYVAQTRHLATLLVRMKPRIEATLREHSKQSRHALAVAFSNYDAAGKLAWATYLKLAQVYTTLCWAPQYALATIARVPSAPGAFTAASLSTAAQAEAASVSGLVVSVLSATPGSGPLSSASVSFSVISGATTVVPATTVCLDLPTPGSAPVNLVTC